MEHIYVTEPYSSAIDLSTSCSIDSTTRIEINKFDKILKVFTQSLRFCILNSSRRIPDLVDERRKACGTS
jgi:hypothetical protein